MIKFAEVKSRNLEKGTVRVTFKEDDDLESYDLPVLQMSTQASKALALPDVGEQVAVSMDKNMVDGCVLGCVYNDTDTAPTENVVDGFHIKLASGTMLQLDKTSKRVVLFDGEGAALYFTDGFANIEGSGGVEISGKDAKVRILNNAESLGALMGELLDAIIALTVPTGTGPSGTPINNPTFSTLKTRFQELFVD
jgi:phage baseplate assembly protein gpV